MTAIAGLADEPLVTDQRLKQALPDVSSSALADGGAALIPYVDIVEAADLDFGGLLADREPVDLARRQGGAAVRQGAEQAGGGDRRALQGAEIHHRLVEVARPVRGQQRLGPGGEFLPGGGGADRRGDAVIPGQHAVDVAVHDGGRQPECDRADGCRRVVAHALESADAVERVREPAECDNLPRGGVQVAGAAVVAQPLPEPQHRVLGRCRQALHVREGGHETLPVGLPLGDPGLLEDDLAEPDGIGVAGAAPRKVPSVVRVPGEQGFGHGKHITKIVNCATSSFFS